MLFRVAATRIRRLEAGLDAIERLAPPGSPLRAVLIGAFARELETATRLLEAAIPAYRKKPPSRARRRADAGATRPAGDGPEPLEEPGPHSRQVPP